MAVDQHQTTKSRKRNHIKSEDELAQSAKHPRTRTYSETDIENWESVMIEELSSIHPKAIRSLLNASKSTIKQQRSRMKQMEATIQRDKMTHEQKERSQNERYAALEKDFTALKAEMASILVANVEYFGPKVSDDTIIGEWAQLGYNVRNIVSNYLTKTLKAKTTDNAMLQLRDTNTRSRLWETIFFHCFGGFAECSKDEIGRILAHHIAWIGNWLSIFVYIKMFNKR